MSFNEHFNSFCKRYNYKGDIGFNKESKEYHIIISKGENNAGAFMTKEELVEMSNKQINNLLDFLHNGFILKFGK